MKTVVEVGETLENSQWMAQQMKKSQNVNMEDNTKNSIVQSEQPHISSNRVSNHHSVDLEVVNELEEQEQDQEPNEEEEDI